MAEILIILWFSLVCVLIAGFILGYQLGKAVTIKRYHVGLDQQVKELINDIASDYTEGIDYDR